MPKWLPVFAESPSGSSPRSPCRGFSHPNPHTTSDSSKSSLELCSNRVTNAGDTDRPNSERRRRNAVQDSFTFFRIELLKEQFCQTSEIEHCNLNFENFDHSSLADKPASYTGESFFSVFNPDLHRKCVAHLGTRRVMTSNVEHWDLLVHKKIASFTRPSEIFFIQCVHRCMSWTKRTTGDDMAKGRWMPKNRRAGQPQHCVGTALCSSGLVRCMS